MGAGAAIALAVPLGLLTDRLGLGRAAAAFSALAAAALAGYALADTGAGIPAEDRPQVFERFFRGDRSRNRQGASGVGLGLSLSREIIRAHGGDLVLAPAQEDFTQFVATLPLVPSGAA